VNAEFQEWMDSLLKEQTHKTMEFLEEHPEAIPVESEMRPDGEGGYRYAETFVILENPEERAAFLKLKEMAKDDPGLKDILNDMIQRAKEKTVIWGTTTE
jgi:hypothetical protein